MLRNPFIDLIVLENLPLGIRSQDIEQLEEDIKWDFTQDALELCVRHYPIKADQSKIVIYLGGCQKRGDLYNFLQNRTFKMVN